MKSNRAKELLRVLPLNRANVEYCLEKGVINGSLKAGIENIVCLAEQDAEERAVSILEDFIAEGLLLTKEDEIVSKFKQLLKGWQSDEKR